MNFDDTIAMIATAMSDAGIGIIRVSGKDAIKIVKKVFRPQKEKDLEKVDSYTAHYGIIYDGKQMLDECIILVMRGPHSYTAEDVVEIQCHGGVVLLKKILELIFRMGARPAEPGEFTKRAFLNGRLDLSQAEAVMDLIHSQNEMAIDNAMKQLKGSVKDKVIKLREMILYHVAFIESALDDPEHINIEDNSERFEREIGQCKKELERLLDTSDDGKIMQDGIKTCIVGKPNVGKSSLLNVLVGEERAIVTEVAGTTRDSLQETVLLQGIPLHIIDTAGIHDTVDIVEKIGVDRAKMWIEDADLILYVVDSSRPLEKNDEKIIELIKEKKVIVLFNKSDLEKKVDDKKIKAVFGDFVIEISAKLEEGMDLLYEKIKEMFFQGEISFKNEVCITNMRHKTALQNALESIILAEQSFKDGMPEDFLSIDLMNAYEQLGFIIGESLEEDLVNKIFQEFCMGK